MFQFHTNWLWLFIAVVAFNVVAVMFVVLPNISVMRENVGTAQKLAEASGNTWAAIKARMTGLWTIASGIVGSLAIALPDFLAQIKALDFSGTALAQYSSIIGLVCIVGMMIAHSITLKAVSGETPVNGGN